MLLYHYTCLDHLRKILDDKEIKLTASNLMQPVSPRLENGTLKDVTDSIKPVVWFTTIDDFNKIAGCGLDGSNYDKTEAVIVVNTTGPQMFYKWDRWAEKNDIDQKWFDALKKAAPQWNTFYVSEQPIPINENTKVAFRPDIMKQFMIRGK